MRIAHVTSKTCVHSVRKSFIKSTHTNGALLTATANGGSTQSLKNAQIMQGRKLHCVMSEQALETSWDVMSGCQWWACTCNDCRRCLLVRQAGVSMCWRRRWGWVNKAQWWWSSSCLTWGRNSPAFYTAASQNNLRPHRAYSLRPRRGNSSVWTSCRPLESTDWFHSQSDRRRRRWTQCPPPWWRSGSPRQQPPCSARAEGIQPRCSSGYPQGHSIGPRRRVWKFSGAKIILSHFTMETYKQVN